MRVSKYQIPTTESGCLLWSVECIYRDGFSLCDDPRTNKGNSDAACHKMANAGGWRALSRFQPQITDTRISSV